MQLSFSSKYPQIKSICESLSVNSLNTKHSQSPGLISADYLVLISYLILLVSSYVKLIITLHFMVSKMYVYFFKYHCNQGCITTVIILGFSSVAFFFFRCLVWFFCDPMGCSLLGSSVPGIFQARILEWVAISLTQGSSGHKTMTYFKLKAS